MKQKFIEWVEKNQKETFTKEEILFFLNYSEYGEDGFKVVGDELAIEYKDKKETLPKKQFELIKLLMENKGRVMNKMEILKKVWESNVIVGERTVDVHICKIKRTFPEIPIVTRKGYGYMWK